MRVGVCTRSVNVPEEEENLQLAFSTCVLDALRGIASVDPIE